MEIRQKQQQPQMWWKLMVATRAEQDDHKTM